MNGGKRPAVFLDRDGVLNLDVGYLHRPQDLVWTEDARAAVKYLNDRNYLVIVVSNQSGIARGMFDAQAVERLHRWINDRMGEAGAHVDAFYYCPHHPTAGSGSLTGPCDCRKPAPGLLLRAMLEWSVDRGASLVIGDKESDLEAARGAGIRGALYSGGSLLARIRTLLES